MYPHCVSGEGSTQRWQIHSQMEEQFMTEPLPIPELSPLDQIRMAESEVSRALIAARETSERATAEARAQASRLKVEARESGLRQGQNRHKEIVSQAEEQAQRIVERANEDAERLKRRGQANMEAAIREAMNIVLGLKGSGSPNES